MSKRTDRIGKLRERVTLERMERTPDGFGGATVSWSQVATCRAEVISFAGREQQRAARTERRSPWRVVTRYREDATSSMRILWRGRTLDIQSVIDPDGERRWLAMDCVETTGSEAST